MNEFDLIIMLLLYLCLLLGSDLGHVCGIRVLTLLGDVHWLPISL